MKKLCALTSLVFALSVFAYAAGPGGPKGPKNNQPAQAAGRERAAEFKKQFQAKREQNTAANKVLYEQYKAAKTDKEKAAVEEKIKAQAAQQVDEGIAMTKQGISGSEESLNKAKERQAKIEKNRNQIIERKVEAIKQGKFVPEAFDKNCDGNQCPLTGIIGGPAPQPPAPQNNIPPKGK